MSNQSDPEKTPPETPAAKPRVNHGVPDPQADPLVAHLYQMVKANPANPAIVLEWLAGRPIEVIRTAILRSQSAPWSIAAEPLVAGLSDDQARAVLAIAIVGFMQGIHSALKQQQR